MKSLFSRVRRFVGGAVPSGGCLSPFRWRDPALPVLSSPNMSRIFQPSQLSPTFIRSLSNVKTSPKHKFSFLPGVPNLNIWIVSVCLWESALGNNDMAAQNYPEAKLQTVFVVELVKLLYFCGISHNKTLCVLWWATADISERRESWFVVFYIPIFFILFILAHKWCSQRLSGFKNTVTCHLQAQLLPFLHIQTAVRVWIFSSSRRDLGFRLGFCFLHLDNIFCRFSFGLFPFHWHGLKKNKKEESTLQPGPVVKPVAQRLRQKLKKKITFFCVAAFFAGFSFFLFAVAGHKRRILKGWTCIQVHDQTITPFFFCGKSRSDLPTGDAVAAASCLEVLLLFFLGLLTWEEAASALASAVWCVLFIIA